MSIIHGICQTANLIPTEFLQSGNMNNQKRPPTLCSQEPQICRLGLNCRQRNRRDIVGWRQNVKNSLSRKEINPQQMTPNLFPIKMRNLWKEKKFRHWIRNLRQLRMSWDSNQGSELVQWVINDVFVRTLNVIRIGNLFRYQKYSTGFVCIFNRHSDEHVHSDHDTQRRWVVWWQTSSSMHDNIQIGCVILTSWTRAITTWMILAGRQSSKSIALLSDTRNGYRIQTWVTLFFFAT